ncbi:hypothetical protein [Tumebacillus lipolyticus]|uniref:DUF304 domain-containing protein n=1 Tax=Tumebacillus lipolyticus TaxID=1280370 RepID=A0ABW4ZX74_9BACL
MRFVAYEQKAPLLLLLAVLPTLFDRSFLWLLILVPLFFLNYELQIHVDEIRYTMKLMGFRLWTRVGTPDLVSRMEFKRAGWATKCVVLHFHSGLRWRLLHFMPKNYDQALEQFAKRHQIALSKHPDYPAL